LRNGWRRREDHEEDYERDHDLDAPQDAAERRKELGGWDRRMVECLGHRAVLQFRGANVAIPTIRPPTTFRIALPEAAAR